MPVRLESDVEKRVVKAAEAKGYWALKLVCQGMRGFPDRWFIKPGPEIILIEFKAVGRTSRPLQKHVHAQLRKLGFTVYADVDTYEEAAEILGL
jgi:hypothetical protein